MAPAVMRTPTSGTRSTGKCAASPCRSGTGDVTARHTRIVFTLPGTHGLPDLVISVVVEPAPVRRPGEDGIRQAVDRRKTRRSARGTDEDREPLCFGGELYLEAIIVDRSGMRRESSALLFSHYRCRRWSRRPSATPAEIEVLSGWRCSRRRTVLSARQRTAVSQVSTSYCFIVFLVAL